jgi:hypothetical protein
MSKSAMQELIDLIRFTDKECYATMYNEGLFDKALKKEKEQIVKDWQKGYSTGCVVGSNDYTNEDEEKDNGNYYYNQTYNQKQHIIDIMKADEDDDLYNQIN